jgi:hypothetical protein
MWNAGIRSAVAADYLAKNNTNILIVYHKIAILYNEIAKKSKNRAKTTKKPSSNTRRLSL